MIKLADGRTVLVSEEDEQFLKQWSWGLVRSTKTAYAGRGERIGGVYFKILMHRIIAERMGLQIEGLEIDHKNHDGLDNRRENLQAVPKAVNQQRSNERSDNTTGFKGINWNKQQQKYVVRLSIEGIRHNLGTVETITEALILLDKGKAGLRYGQA
jgi:HNH endonuclease